MNSINNKPAASVILPVYNAEKYLNAAIESVLGQSLTDFELLLLNDGSNDGSLDRLQYFAAGDARCKIYSWPNQGLIATLNAGVQLAIADILIRMDADDICRSERFAMQIAYLRTHSECVAVGSHVMLIDADGEPICRFAEEVEHKAIDAAHLAGRGGAIAHPAAAMRKQALLDIGGYRAEYSHAEDLDLFLRLAEVGQLANLPEVLLEYRQHIGSIGYRHKLMQQDATRRAVADAWARRGLGQSVSPERSDPANKTPSLADVHRKWAWWALNAGNLETAKKHAWKALTLEPFSKESLKLCACVLRGH